MKKSVMVCLLGAVVTFGCSANTDNMVEMGETPAMMNMKAQLYEACPGNWNAEHTQYTVNQTEECQAILEQMRKFASDQPDLLNVIDDFEALME